MIEKYAFVAGWKLRGEVAGSAETGFSSAAEQFSGELFDFGACEMVGWPQNRQNQIGRLAAPDSFSVRRNQ